MITNIDKFSNLRFITSSIDPGQLTGKVLKDAQNSIIINTYSGHIGIFVCDGEGNIQRATAEFSNDFNIDGNVASISGAVNELKQQIKDLRDAFNSLSNNGGSVHVPLVTNPPLPKPISVALSPSNVTISDNDVVEVIITTTYDKNFRFPSDIIEPSISTGATGIMHDIRSYSKQNNVCQHKLRLSKNSNAERNNTITVSVGNAQATLGVTVTKPNDVYAKITRIRTSVDNIVFNNDNTTATITVQKELSEGIRDDKRLNTQIIQSEGITVDRVEYTATADKYYISPSGGNGSIKFCVKDENFNSGVNNITVGVVDKRTVVSPSPSVTPTVPPVPKSLRRISKVTVNSNEPVSIKAGTIKTVNYTVTYNGTEEETITDANTDNIDISSNGGITVEVDKKTKTITFTTPRTLSAKQVDFDITSNDKVVGAITVNATALAIQRISKVTVNGNNSVQFKAGTPTTVNYTVDYVGELPDNDTNNVDISSNGGITVEVDKKTKTITFTTPRTLGTKNVDFDITSNGKVVGTVNVGVTALPLRRITEVTVNTTNSVQFKAGTDTVVNYTVTYSGDPEHTNSDGKEDNIEIVSKDGIDVGINYPTKQIMFSTESDLSAKSNISFDVISNSKKVGEFTVTVTAQEPKRISNVTVNSGNPVTITAGTDSIVSYSIDTYTGELPDYNTDIIAVASKDNIKVDVDKKTKTIKFRLLYDLISAKSVSFDVISNGNVVGTITVNVRYNIVLKNGLGENPMILVQNRSVALSTLANITGTHGTLKCKSTDFVLEDAVGYLSFTENENKEGTVTLYVDEDKTVEKSFTVKMYKVSDVEIYAAGKDLTSGVLQHELPLQLDTRFTDRGVTFFNDTNTFRKEVTWSVENAPSNPNFVATITNTGLFSTNSPSRYNITAIVTYKANGREVYRESTFKQITVSKNELMRPRFISLDPERIEITAGTSKEIRYSITSYKGSDTTDDQKDTITVKPKNAEYNGLVDITVMSGDNKIRITPKVTNVDRTVILGIYDADNNEVRNFDVKIKGVQEHGLVLKKGVVTPIVLFNGNTIYPDNLVTITNSYNKDNEKLVVTSSDIFNGTYASPTIHEDVTKPGTIRIHFLDDANTYIDIPVQQYKLRTVSFNNAPSEVVLDTPTQFTLKMDIDPKITDSGIRKKFGYKVTSWYVTNEDDTINNQIGTINNGVFRAREQKKCKVRADIVYLFGDKEVGNDTIVKDITVIASNNQNYALFATTFGVNDKVNINQFTAPLSQTIEIASYILDGETIISPTKPSIEVITTNGAPKGTINVYLTENGDKYNLTIASATHSKENSKTLKGTSGVVKLTVGKGSINKRELEIPFVKHYDSPISGISIDGNSTVVIRSTDKYKSATISGTIRYNDKVKSVLQRDDNGHINTTYNLSGVTAQLGEWNKPNPKDNKWNEWTIGEISSGYGRFSIPVSVKQLAEESGYESKLMVYSEADPSWNQEVHLVYWKENGDNSLVEPTVSPTPDVPTGNTSGSTPRP